MPSRSTRGRLGRQIDTDALRARRRDRGFSSAEALADVIGIHKDSMYRIEQGRRRPSREIYAALIEALGAEEGDFLASPPQT